MIPKTLLPRRSLLALLPLLLLAACRGSSPTRRDDIVPPFVFRSLDLKQQSPKGEPAWELTSPEARYDIRRRIAQAINPKGVIYADGKPRYRVQADSGTVVNDGEAILLEGHLRVERVGPQPVLIEAARARWLPRKQLMLIDRRPAAYDRQGRLRAQRARFLFNDDRLELTGQPQLDRWGRPFDPFGALPKEVPEIVLQATQISWSPGNGALVATGPLLGHRTPSDRSAGASPQELSAEGLEGNTLTHLFTLKGSVRYTDTAQGDSFVGRDVRFNPATSEASTRSNFQANRGSLQASGAALRVDGKEHWLRIDGDCRVNKPEERLEAERCAWNWQSGAVEAKGAVRLERSSNAQVTRGGSISGQLGKEGTILIRAPGGRVVSQFRLPARPESAPAAPRPAPEPIVP